MASLNAVLNIAASGLNASQLGLRTVSDNIANVNTPGYVRKTLDHKFLNNVEALGAPTLENITRFIWERVQHAGTVTRVSVYRDSCQESCTYFGPQT